MPTKPFDPVAAAREFTADVPKWNADFFGTRNKLAAQRGADLNSAVATVMKKKSVSRLQAIQLLTDYARKANFGLSLRQPSKPKTPTPAVTSRRPRARPTGTPTPRPTLPHNPIAGY